MSDLPTSFSNKQNPHPATLAKVAASLRGPYSGPTPTQHLREEFVLAFCVEHKDYRHRLGGTLWDITRDSSIFQEALETNGTRFSSIAEAVISFASGGCGPYDQKAKYDEPAVVILERMKAIYVAGYDAEEMEADPDYGPDADVMRVFDLHPSTIMAFYLRLRGALEEALRDDDEITLGQGDLKYLRDRLHSNIYWTIEQFFESLAVLRESQEASLQAS